MTAAVRLGRIMRALDGTPDYGKVLSQPSARPGWFTLAELLGLGVSNDGIRRVLTEDDPHGVAADKVEPRPLAGSSVLLEDLEHLGDRVLVGIDVKHGPIDVQLDHERTVEVSVTVRVSS